MDPNQHALPVGKPTPVFLSEPASSSVCTRPTKSCLPPNSEYLAEAYNGDMDHVMFIGQLHILADAAIGTSECTPIEMEVHESIHED